MLKGTREVELVALVKQYTGSTVRALIKNHYLNNKLISTSLAGEWESLDDIERTIAAELWQKTHDMSQHPQFWGLDLGKWLRLVCSEADEALKHRGVTGDDQVLFGFFNVMVLHLAHEVEVHPEFRKIAGIKRGLFW